MPRSKAETLGIFPDQDARTMENRRADLVAYTILKLVANGLPHPPLSAESDTAIAERLLATYHQRLRLLDGVRCPADARIQSFLEDHLADVADRDSIQLPTRTITLDRHGLSREMSLPVDGDKYENDLVSSYRVQNGVLHNPQHDRRTTSGTFHVAEGGLPISHDKVSVPKKTFAAMLQRACNPPSDILNLPFTANLEEPARAFVSLLLRPMVVPEVPGVSPRKTMETRFFAPGILISNLDFVESIFGNAGDPFLPENDAGLDVEHWTGHTGCVILAPHLVSVPKKDVGLPHHADATDRQRHDGMCWKEEDEVYNNGTPFKLTCRTDAGVVVTLIADNYYGYCKKEVKTQLSYAANLYGNAEEEHAGGALAYASFNLGDDFLADSKRYNQRSMDDVLADYDGKLIKKQPGGYARGIEYPNLVFVPEDAYASVNTQSVSWTRDGEETSIPLLPREIYMTPSGYKLNLSKHPAAPSWRLIGTLPEGVFCHKPCTVSGGGKSEISKSIADYVLHGSIFTANLEEDLDLVQEIFDRDYSDRWAPDGNFKPDYTKRAPRNLLDPNRSLGSVIKLLTPSPDYTKEYNEWLDSISGYIYALVFVIKQIHHETSDDNWRDSFTVDIINGLPGHELKYGDRVLRGSYLRVGLFGEHTWRTYKLRQDFSPAQKVQTEDDISASIVVPRDRLDALGKFVTPAVAHKFVVNCESRLFQRPDDAVHRGLDRQAEADLAQRDNFLVNFEPLDRAQISKICDQVIDLSQFTEPMQRLLKDARESKAAYTVCSAEPRRIDGVPTKNPRYLQTRPDLMDGFNRHVAEMGTRLYRAIPADREAQVPAQSVLMGRRNNPSDRKRGFRPLAVYNPIHYQELPELFMDLISSLTGKSPSTTGAGSEGALTKGPFNAVPPIVDLNNALVSYLLTGLAGFSTPAGHIGSQVRVDHDISLLIPEIWCRMSPEERDPAYLISEGLVDRVEDFDYEGKIVPASLLGYRINTHFVRRIVGRVFDNPSKVFNTAILRPETQDIEEFADGVWHIVEAHQRVSKAYFEDGSVELACRPLKALLHIMAHGDFDGMTVKSPEIRELFSAEWLLGSDWYRSRLERKQGVDRGIWQRHVEYLTDWLEKRAGDDERGEIEARLEFARGELERVSSDDYAASLHGMLGRDPGI